MHETPKLLETLQETLVDETSVISRRSGRHNTSKDDQSVDGMQEVRNSSPISARLTLGFGATQFFDAHQYPPPFQGDTTRTNSDGSALERYAVVDASRGNFPSSTLVTIREYRLGAQPWFANEVFVTHEHYPSKPARN